jgi:hypothetical protein
MIRFGMRYRALRKRGVDVAKDPSTSTVDRTRHRQFAQGSVGASLLDELDRIDTGSPDRDERTRIGGASSHELRELRELESDLLWDDLQRKREARAIAVDTAIGWVRVVRQILFVVAGFVAIALGATGHIDFLELVRALR